MRLFDSGPVSPDQTQLCSRLDAQLSAPPDELSLALQDPDPPERAIARRQALSLMSSCLR